MPSRQPQPDQHQREAQFAAVLLATQAQSAQIRTSLLGYIERLWRSLGSYREPDMRRFTTEIVPVVAEMQQRMVSLTAASLAQQEQVALGVPFRPVALDDRQVTGAAVRNGADPTEVYERPFHLVWRELAELPREPASIDTAIQSGLDRAQQLAATDLQLAKQHAALKIMGHNKRIVGYRRVLEGIYSCAKCIVASTQRYHKGTLLPMHPACDCGIAEIWADSDPGRVIESMVNTGTADAPKLVHVADLADVHERIEEAFGKSSSSARSVGATGSKDRLIQYQDALIVHEHGELGPVLAVRGQHFTGPSEILQHKRPKVA